MFLKQLLIFLFLFLCVSLYAEKQKKTRRPPREEWRAPRIDDRGKIYYHPGDIIFPEDKNFLELSLKERFRVLYERRVSYDEFNDPKYANPKYGSLYYKWNPLNPDPKIEKEIIAKLRLIRLFCGPFRAKTPVPTMQENAEMASALIADYLSEDEWGQARMEAEEFKLRSQNFTEAYITDQLQRRKNFYARRLRRTRDSDNMTTLLCAAEDFISLLLYTYPDNMDKAVELYEKSLLPQKTTWGKMSECYYEMYDDKEGNIHPSLVPDYNAIREAEARRERGRSTAE